MRAAKSPRMGLRMLGCSCVMVILFLLFAATTSSAARRSRRTDSTVSRDFADARALFQKVWQPGVASKAGGDGLGPVYNENSCAGCHHLGGMGGAARNQHNVTLLTAFAGPVRCEKGEYVFQGELEDLHPGFRNHTSIVIHDHATSPFEEARLKRIRNYLTADTRDGLVALGTSSRNTPALFGDGLIDNVSDKALLDAAKRGFAAFPEIKGRVSRLHDGRLGRFGWKGQSARLRDFVLSACANELGLEVTGHHQVSLASHKDFDRSKLRKDLTDSEADLLVWFVANLPKPVIQPVDPFLTTRGAEVFRAIGCATCHAPRLDQVSAIYSDLLLHDLGDLMRDSGGGYGMSSTRGRIVDRSSSNDGPLPSGDAGPTEWRTAPLWGVADSAPYLHDGRAATLDEAIRLHGGEAAATARRYAKLSFMDNQSLLAFLHSLCAPPAPMRSMARAL